MANIGMIKSVIMEYGVKWAVNRLLYSIKLKILKRLPLSEKLFEKKSLYPQRLDLFKINTDELCAFLKENLSDIEKEQLINIANKACDGIITGFSSVELNYGNPIDWQLNPLTGKRCSESEKWYRISDFDEQRGDIKAIWEASRFSHFITLSRAYLLTNDKKYYTAFSSQLNSWLEKNPYSYGANFKCGQECSLRMVNTMLAYAVFKRNGITTDADENNVKELIYRCYKKVLSNFFYAYNCIKNNHTISELMGMIVGAWCCEDNKRIDKAYKLLDKVIDEQFTDDGGYSQFSFNYQRLALQDLEVVMSMATITAKQLSERSKEKIKKSAELMYQCQDKNGDMPNYGSNDGALIFPVTSCGYRDFTPVINTVYALTTGTQLYTIGKHQEELIWFSGEKKLAQYESQKITRCSSNFKDAGLFTIRGQDSWVMMVSNEYHSRPAHMDQNHIDLWICGYNVLCDGGTYSYASDIGRKLVRNENHNTVFVNGLNQMSTAGPFMVYNWTNRKLIKTDTSIIESKIVSKNGYSHNRKLEKTEEGYLLTDIVDEDYCVLFHTPYEVIVKNRVANIFSDGILLCSILCNGDIAVEKANRSLYYMQKDEITCININGSKNQELKTIIKIEGEK